MVRMDGAALEEWVVGHKGQSRFLIVLAILFLLTWFFLYKPTLNYQHVLNDLQRLEKKWVQLKKEMMAREVLIHEKRDQINQCEKRADDGGGQKSLALWFAHHLGQCGISQYGFEGDNSLSSGGHGRPIFTLKMRLNYEQGMCALRHFSHSSNGWKLSEMSVNREADIPLLTMKLTMEILR